MYLILHTNIFFSIYLATDTCSGGSGSLLFGISCNHLYQKVELLFGNIPQIFCTWLGEIDLQCHNQHRETGAVKRFLFLFIWASMLKGTASSGPEV